MTRFAGTLTQKIFHGILLFGMTWTVATAADLSKYRNFQLGSDLRTIAKQAAAKPSEAKVIHRRPVLIQELEWRAQPTISTESQKDVVFSFYDGTLFRILIKYDSNETEGLTAADMVEAISRTYGVALPDRPAAKVMQGRYADEEEVLARWEDSNYHFDLIRSSYGGRLSLLGLLKRLEEPAGVAIAEATALDLSEAPQRESERIAKESEVERAKLEKARFANKPRFRP